MVFVGLRARWDGSFIITYACMTFVTKPFVYALNAFKDSVVMYQWSCDVGCHILETVLCIGLEGF